MGLRREQRDFIKNAAISVRGALREASKDEDVCLDDAVGEPEVRSEKKRRAILGCVAEAARSYSLQGEFYWGAAAKFCDNMVIKSLAASENHPSWAIISEILEDDKDEEPQAAIYNDPWVIHFYLLHFAIALAQLGLKEQAQAMEVWIAKFIQYTFTTQGARPSRSAWGLLESDAVRKLPLALELADKAMDTARLSMAQCSGFGEWVRRYPYCSRAFAIAPRHLFEAIGAGASLGWTDGVPGGGQFWLNGARAEDVPEGVWQILVTAPWLEEYRPWAMSQTPRLGHSDIAAIMAHGDSEVRNWAMRRIGGALPELAPVTGKGRRA